MTDNKELEDMFQEGEQLLKNMKTALESAKEQTLVFELYGAGWGTTYAMTRQAEMWRTFILKLERKVFSLRRSKD